MNYTELESLKRQVKEYNRKELETLLVDKCIKLKRESDMTAFIGIFLLCSMIIIGTVGVIQGSRFDNVQSNIKIMGADICNNLNQTWIRTTISFWGNINIKCSSAKFSNIDNGK